MLKALSPYIIWSIIPLFLLKAGDYTFYYSLFGLPLSFLILSILYNKKFQYAFDIVKNFDKTQKLDFYLACIFSAIGQITYIFIFLSPDQDKALGYFISSSYGIVYYFLAHFILEKAKLNYKDILIILISFIGLWLIKKDNLNIVLNSSIMFGFLRALFGGISSFYLKKVFWKKDPANSIDFDLIILPRILIQFVVIGGTLFFLYPAKFYDIQIGQEFYYVLIGAILSYTIAYQYINYSLYYFNKITVVNLGNISKLMAVCVIVLFNDEVLMWSDYLGVTLIIGSSYLAGLKKDNDS